MEKIGNIILGEEEIDLDSSSIELLKEKLNELNKIEQRTKKELDTILKKLY